MRKIITYQEILIALNDWAKSELLSKNIKFNENKDQFIQYLNYFNKLISNNKRKVSCSKCFKVSDENESGLNKLIKKMEKGEDVNCHLSKLIGNAENIDYLLDGYGIKHFHLGVEKEGNFIKRTGELALGFITKEEVFFITTKNHGDDTWYGKDVLEILHKERPDLIEHAKVRGVCGVEPKITSVEDIKLCRKNQLSIAIELDDGTVYFQNDLGTTLAGYSSSHIFNQQHIAESIMNYINENVLQETNSLINSINLKIINIIPNSEILGELSIYHIIDNKFINEIIPLHLEKRKQ
jgi:hypothetical protein